MTFRELEAGEFERLKGLALFDKTPPPDPSTARIMVAENHLGEIVGVGAVVFAAHLEPMWVREDYRGGLTASRLWKSLTRLLLDTLHIPVGFCFSDRPEIEGFLVRLGLKRLPFSIFMYDPTNICPVENMSLKECRN